MRALGRQYVQLRKSRATLDCWISEFFKKPRIQYIKNENISKALKLAAIKLDYPEIRGIETKDINTHYLRATRGNVLYLEGYKDREIQK